MGAIPEFMVSRLSAWHRAGDIIGDFQTADEVLAHPAMSQQVEKRQLFTLNQEIINGVVYNHQINVPVWATFGCDDGVCYGPVGEDYTVLQHSEGIRLLDTLIGLGAKRFETAGTLFGGSVVFCSVALDKTLSVGNDESKLYLNFITSHNGKYAFSFKISSIRIVCQNTLEASLSAQSKAGFKVYHTKNAQLAFNDAKLGMEAVTHDIDKLEENLNFLASKLVSRDAMSDVMRELFLSKTAKGTDKLTTGSKRAETVFNNRLEEILERYANNDNNAFPEQRGTAYNLLQAITGYVDHGEKKRSFEYATLGQGNDLKNRALEVITLAANGMPSKETRYTVAMSEALPTMENQDIVADLLAGR